MGTYELILLILSISSMQKNCNIYKQFVST